jgi:hypothetical protein
VAAIPIYLLLPQSALPGALERVNALAALILLIGAIPAALRLRQAHRAMLLDVDLSVPRLLDAYRAALSQRRDLYLQRSPWSLWPVVLASGVLILGRMVYEPGPYAFVTPASAIAIVIVMTFLGRRAARRNAEVMQRELDALASC